MSPCYRRRRFRRAATSRVWNRPHLFWGWLLRAFRPRARVHDMTRHDMMGHGMSRRDLPRRVVKVLVCLALLNFPPWHTLRATPWSETPALNRAFMLLWRPGRDHPKFCTAVADLEDKSLAYTVNHRGAMLSHDKYGIPVVLCPYRTPEVTPRGWPEPEPSFLELRVTLTLTLTSCPSSYLCKLPTLPGRWRRGRGSSGTLQGQQQEAPARRAHQDEGYGVREAGGSAAAAAAEADRAHPRQGPLHRRRPARGWRARQERERRGFGQGRGWRWRLQPTSLASPGKGAFVLLLTEKMPFVERMSRRACGSVFMLGLAEGWNEEWDT